VPACGAGCGLGLDAVSARAGAPTPAGAFGGGDGEIAVWPEGTGGEERVNGAGVPGTPEGAGAIVPVGRVIACPAGATAAPVPVAEGRAIGSCRVRPGRDTGKNVDAGAGVPAVPARVPGMRNGPEATAGAVASTGAEVICCAGTLTRFEATGSRPASVEAETAVRAPG